MNMREFSTVNRLRCEHPAGFNHKLDSWSMSDWFTALFGEIGEAANNQKKLNRIRDGIPGNKETEDQLKGRLAKELGDAYIYLDLLAQAAGIDLPIAVITAFNDKSQEIGYPLVYIPD